MKFSHSNNLEQAGHTVVLEPVITNRASSQELAVSPALLAEMSPQTAQAYWDYVSSVQPSLLLVSYEITRSQIESMPGREG